MFLIKLSNFEKTEEGIVSPDFRGWIFDNWREVESAIGLTANEKSYLEEFFGITIGSELRNPSGMSPFSYLRAYTREMGTDIMIEFFRRNTIKQEKLQTL